MGSTGMVHLACALVHSGTKRDVLLFAGKDIRQPLLGTGEVVLAATSSLQAEGNVM